MNLYRVAGIAFISVIMLGGLAWIYLLGGFIAVLGALFSAAISITVMLVFKYLMNHDN